jgi:hypothetical protein
MNKLFIDIHVFYIDFLNIFMVDFSFFNFLGTFCATLSCILSPEVIILGGGVLKRHCLYEKIRKYFLQQLNGYLRVPKMIGKHNI